MKYLFQGLALSLLCHAVEARVYTFDPADLGLDAAEIELFNQGGQLPGVYFVDIWLNDQRVDSRELLFQQQNLEQGESLLEPCLTVEMLARYGVKVEDYPQLAKNEQNRDADEQKMQCVDLSSIPQAFATFQFNEQKLLLSIPQISLRQKITGIAPKELWNDGVPVFLMNYLANTHRSEYHGNVTSASDSQFVQIEPGINLGAWRLRNASAWHQHNKKGGKWQTAYTYAEYGMYNVQSRLTLGDRYTPSEVFESVPFRGVMLGSDDAMVPFNQSTFAPVVRGIARTQARVEVKQNGFTLYSTTVAPGPFELADFSPGTGAGNLEVTVWETDGQPQVFTVPFSTPAIALRKGYFKYNVMGGRYRAADSNIDDAMIGQTTMIYGLPWDMTLYGGVQGAERYQSAALGLGASLGSWGGLSVDVTRTHGELKGAESETGGAWRIRYGKAVDMTNTSLTLSSTHYSSSYLTLPDVLSNSSNVRDRRKSSTTLTLGQSLKKWGYLSLNAVRNRYHNQPKSEDSFGANYNVGLGAGSVSLGWTQNRRTDRLGQQRNEQMFSLMFSLPIDRWLSGASHASYQYFSSSNGRHSQQIGVNGTALDRRLNWRVNQRYQSGSSNANRSNSSLSLSWLSSYARLSGMYSYSPSIRNMSADIAGGVVVHRNGITFSQPLNGTVALVEAPGASNVKVGDWPGVKTDFRGYTTLAHLSPYQQNTVSLDPNTFPVNAEVTQTSQTIIPTQDAVISVKFPTRVGERALMRLTREDGSYVPFGAPVVLEGESNFAGIVDESGVVYLTGLPASGWLLAQWGANQQNKCAFKYQLPKNPGPGDIYEMDSVCH